MSLLSVENLGIDFGGVRAVDGVSFDADPGKVVSVIGPNGAGKTTLFNMVSGVYRPGRGKVMLDGKEVTGLPPHRLAELGLSRTFQNLQVYLHMTALENVMAGRHLGERCSVLADLLNLPSSRRRTRETEEIAHRLLAMVGLEKVGPIMASSLSYGALKRLEIARALAANPRLLLLDEPAAGCNAVETEEIDKLIADISSGGVAILLVEHDMKLVMKISSHIVVLDHGEKIAEGPPALVSKDAKVIEAYLGPHADDAHALG